MASPGGESPLPSILARPILAPSRGPPRLHAASAGPDIMTHGRAEGKKISRGGTNRSSTTPNRAIRPPDARRSGSGRRSRPGGDCRPGLVHPVHIYLRVPHPAEQVRWDGPIRSGPRILLGDARRPDRDPRGGEMAQAARRSQAGDALPGGLFRAGGEVEHLDRDPAIVARLDERGQDRAEIHVAHARDRGGSRPARGNGRPAGRGGGSGRGPSSPARCSGP